MGETQGYTQEDVGNIVLLEHVNVQIPDQALATLFYIVGLGFTRDPYLNVGLRNMWANVGEQEFHLPTGDAQRVPGHIGLVLPDLERLQERLKAVQEQLKPTQFSWHAENEYVSVTCPWGNQLRCYAPEPKFGDIALGMPYVEFRVRPGAAKGIAAFYREVLRAPSVVESAENLSVARVDIGRNQWLLFRESSEELPPYDGHHIAIYVANFSGPYEFLNRRSLVTEDVRNHQFRFQAIIDPETGEKLHELEHEVRSLRHPMYHRPFVNRNPDQTQRAYQRGRDALTPFGS